MATWTGTEAKDDERTQFLTDVMTAAVEGGINYWASVSEYRWDCEPALRGVTVHESDEEEESPTTKRIGLGDIASALAKLRERGASERYHIGGRLLGVILVADEENDAGGVFDAEAADAVMQVAVLGDCIYG